MVGICSFDVQVEEVLYSSLSPKESSGCYLSFLFSLFLMRNSWGGLLRVYS